MSRAAALHGAGDWAAPGAAHTPPHSIHRASPSGAELYAFERAIRPRWWRWLSPLYVTLAFGAAVVWGAGATPPTVTVRRLLTPASEAPAPPPAADEYELPAHWQ